MNKALKYFPQGRRFIYKVEIFEVTGILIAKGNTTKSGR
jgi:hypothetical protein